MYNNYLLDKYVYYLLIAGDLLYYFTDAYTGWLTYNLLKFFNLVHNFLRHMAMCF